MQPRFDTGRRRTLGQNQLSGRYFRRRAWVALLGVSLIFLGLFARFYYLQVVEHSRYSSQSEANRVRIRPIAPNRGLIYDRNGMLLARNVPAYRLEVIPEQVGNLEAMLEELANVIPLSETDRSRVQRLRKLRRSFQPIPVKLRLSEADLARFAVNRYRFPGVEAVPYLSRDYPLGETMAHVLGYVGHISEKELARLDEKRYRGTNLVGKTGLEAYYEDALHGEPGFEEVETNAQGRVLRVLRRELPQPGEDLHLTLDAGLQQAAYKALGQHRGAVVAMKPESGEILALVSKPSFDPNPFVTGILHRDYQALLSQPGRPLFNRALLGGYEPGSTIKPFMALAGLASGVLSPDETWYSDGTFQIPGRKRIYRDWKKGGHGKVNLEQALAQSVNGFFYNLALRMGIDRIHDWLAPFGFGQVTGIDMPREKPGLLPSRAWKRAVHNSAWFDGETVIVGIGQGPFVVTPLQLAWAVNKLASRKDLPRPHLKKMTEPWPEQSRLDRIPPAAWEQVQKGMVAVVHGAHGSARRIGHGLPFTMAGKTGTAQVFGHKEDATDEERKVEGLAEHLKHHALFIAYAPVEKPQIAVAVVVEHGGGGSRVAAPVARDVIRYWLERQP